MGKQMQSVNLSADNQWLTPWEHTAVTKLRRYKWLNQAPITRWFTPKLIPTNTFSERICQSRPDCAAIACTEWKQGCSISDGGWTQLPNLDFLSVLKSIRFLHFHRAALSNISTLKTPDDSLLCCLQFRKPSVDCFVAKLLTDLARSRRPLSCSSRQRSAQKFDQNCIYNKTQFIRYTTEETCAQKPTKLEFHSTQRWIWRRNCSF